MYFYLMSKSFSIILVVEGGGERWWVLLLVSRLNSKPNSSLLPQPPTPTPAFTTLYGVKTEGKKKKIYPPRCCTFSLEWVPWAKPLLCWSEQAQDGREGAPPPTRPCQTQRAEACPPPGDHWCPAPLHSGGHRDGFSESTGGCARETPTLFSWHCDPSLFSYCPLHPRTLFQASGTPIGSYLLEVHEKRREEDPNLAPTPARLAIWAKCAPPPPQHCL